MSRAPVPGAGPRPPPRIRQTLVEGEAAKLARLSWELEEMMRKSAWDYRPEAAGTEATSWRRAIAKFSGAFTAERFE